MNRTPTNMQDALGGVAGLMLRERVYLSQVACGACEKKTNMLVGSWLPTDQAGGGGSAGAHLDDSSFLHALRTRSLFEIREESDCLCRYCCHQWREVRRREVKSRERRSALYGCVVWCVLRSIARVMRCVMQCVCDSPSSHTRFTNQLPAAYPHAYPPTRRGQTSRRLPTRLTAYPPCQAPARRLPAARDDRRGTL